MSDPINEVALLLKTSVMRSLKQLALLLRVFSKPTAMDHAGMQLKELLYTFKL